MIARKTAARTRAEHYPKETSNSTPPQSTSRKVDATESRNHKPAGLIVAGSSNRSKKSKSRDAPGPALPTMDPCPRSAAEKQGGGESTTCSSSGATLLRGWSVSWLVLLCFRLFNGAVPLCVRSNGKAGKGRAARPKSGGPASPKGETLLICARKRKSNPCANSTTCTVTNRKLGRRAAKMERKNPEEEERERGVRRDLSEFSARRWKRASQ
jgi:hypothetical protein